LTTQQDVDQFFKRNAQEFGNQHVSQSMGGNGGVAYGLEGEKNPQEFITVYKVALDGKIVDGKRVKGKFAPSNKAFRIKKTELERTLAKRVRDGRPDAGSAIFALQPVKVAGEATEVISSNHTKSRKRRKRRRRSRG
jgi:hypothetical protein